MSLIVDPLGQLYWWAKTMKLDEDSPMNGIDEAKIG